MKIHVKTHLVEIQVDDEPIIEDGYTKRSVPSLNESIKAVITEAARLHNEVAKSI